MNHQAMAAGERKPFEGGKTSHHNKAPLAGGLRGLEHHNLEGGCTMIVSRSAFEIKETWTNETCGYHLGDSGWYEPYTDNIATLFRSLQREYGRCVSRVYVDTPDGESDAIGWYFEKTLPYEDARSKHDVFVRGCWVTYRRVLR